MTDEDYGTEADDRRVYEAAAHAFDMEGRGREQQKRTRGREVILPRSLCSVLTRSAAQMMA
jgi:hypothetical protein